MQASILEWCKCHSRIVRVLLYVIAIGIVIFGISHGWLKLPEGTWNPLGGAY